VLSTLRRLSAVALLAGALACAAPGGSGPRPAPGAASARVLRGAELARVSCLFLAPFENATDDPLAADAATGALLRGLDPTRARAYPLPDLRALFRDTPLELPDGVGPSLALELAALLGADAALHGAVEGRTADGRPELLVTLRLALVDRDLLWAAEVPVAVAPGEAPARAVARAVEEAARPVLLRLGAPGGRACFGKERAERLRALALAQGGAGGPPAPAPAAGAPGRPAPTGPSAASAPPPARAAAALAPRAAEWARRLAAGERVLLEDVAFAGRSADLARDAGLADLAAALGASPGLAVRLEGFVDRTSDAPGDAQLSMAMAQAAGQRLALLGVPRARLSWAGRGAESPILPNFTARGRAANRRVEAVALR
jgi:outer membrane protein OmpA-like peptidoglycan-associated protein